MCDNLQGVKRFYLIFFYYFIAILIFCVFAVGSKWAKKLLFVDSEKFHLHLKLCGNKDQKYFEPCSVEIFLNSIICVTTQLYSLLSSAFLCIAVAGIPPPPNKQHQQTVLVLAAAAGQLLSGRKEPLSAINRRFLLGGGSSYRPLPHRKITQELTTLSCCICSSSQTKGLDVWCPCSAFRITREQERLEVQLTTIEVVYSPNLASLFFPKNTRLQHLFQIFIQVIFSCYLNTPFTDDIVIYVYSGKGFKVCWLFHKFNFFSFNF